MNTTGDSAIKVGFMSAIEGRDGWTKDKDAPFTSPFRAQVPGPGHYDKKERNMEMKAKIFSLLDGRSFASFCSCCENAI